MKKWVLRKPYKNKRIVASAKTKRGVIRKKAGLQFSRKEIKNMKQGDVITIRKQRTYEKWVTEEIDLGYGLRKTPIKKEVTKNDDYDLLLDRVQIKSV